MRSAAAAPSGSAATTTERVTASRVISTVAVPSGSRAIPVRSSPGSSAADATVQTTVTPAVGPSRIRARSDASSARRP